MKGTFNVFLWKFGRADKNVSGIKENVDTIQLSLCTVHFQCLPLRGISRLRSLKC